MKDELIKLTNDYNILKLISLSIKNIIYQKKESELSTYLEELNTRFQVLKFVEEANHNSDILFNQQNDFQHYYEKDAIKERQLIKIKLVGLIEESIRKFIKTKQEKYFKYCNQNKDSLRKSYIDKEIDDIIVLLNQIIEDLLFEINYYNNNYIINTNDQGLVLTKQVEALKHIYNNLYDFTLTKILSEESFVILEQEKKANLNEISVLEQNILSLEANLNKFEDSLNNEEFAFLVKEYRKYCNLITLETNY